MLNMKCARPAAFLLIAFLPFVAGFALAQQTGKRSTDKEAIMMKIRFIVEDTTLTASLDDTPAARDFAALLPLELTLKDYHATEKVADLPRALNTEGAPPSYTPSTGDITFYAPWGNLAIFYKNFPSSAGLVRLGQFDGDLGPLRRTGSFNVRIEAAD